MESEFNDPSEFVQASTEDHPVDHFEDPNSNTFLTGCLKDACARWQGDIPKTIQEMRGIFLLILESGIREAVQMGRDETKEIDAVEGVLRLLNELASDSCDSRLTVEALRLALNHTSKSEESIAKLCGVTKQAVSKRKIQLQERFGLKPRCGRDKEAREKFRTICKARGKKQRTAWTGAKILSQALQSKSNTGTKRPNNTETQHSVT